MLLLFKSCRCKISLNKCIKAYEFSFCSSFTYNGVTVAMITIKTFISDKRPLLDMSKLKFCFQIYSCISLNPFTRTGFAQNKDNSAKQLNLLNNSNKYCNLKLSTYCIGNLKLDRTRVTNTCELYSTAFHVLVHAVLIFWDF